MPAKGGGREGKAGGPWVRTLGVTGPAAPALPAQTAKVRSLLGPEWRFTQQGAPSTHPLKGQGEWILPPKLLQLWKCSPKAAPSPSVAPLPGSPGTQPLSPGPHHLPGWWNSHLTPRSLRTQPWRGGPRRCALYPKRCFFNIILGVGHRAGRQAQALCS